jgi:DNA polymerase-3 subunit epsilon
MQGIFHREEPRDLSAAARFYLGREHQEAHTALGDIRTTAAVLAAQIERYPDLPRDMDALHGYCDEVFQIRTAVELWFKTEGTELIFRRGMHKGRSLAEVAAQEGDYLEWMLGADDMDMEVLEVVQAALAGREAPAAEEATAAGETTAAERATAAEEATATEQALAAENEKEG